MAAQEKPPARFIAGADSIESTEKKIADLQKQIAAYRELSTSLAFDEAGAPAKGANHGT